MAALVSTAGEHIETIPNFSGLGLILGAHIMRKIILSTTAAITLFSPAAFAQKPSQGTASIPDFSGVWAHPSGYVEPLASGPRPVLNRAHRDGKNDPYLTVGDYTNPILKTVAAQVVKKHGEISLAGLANPTPRHSLLAVGGTLHFFSTWHADVTTGGQDHFPLPPGS